MEDTGEAKSLAELPAAEPNVVKKSIIRTTIKNENLLAKKMESNRIKKANRKNTSHLKSKIERSNKNNGILSNKIEQSIARANYIQKYRKADWDKINKEINSGAVMNEDDDSLQTKKQIERDEEDKYVKQFFSEGNDKNEEEDENQVTSSNASPAQGNKFAILDEIEA